MTNTTKLVACIAALWAVWLFPAIGKAEQRLREFERAPFSVATQARIPVSVLTMEDQASFAAASVLPKDISALDIVQFRWPKSERTCTVGVARGMAASLMSGNATQQGAGAPTATYLTLAVGDNPAKKLELAGKSVEGFLSRLCVWPTTNGEEAELVLLMSFSSNSAECSVLGVSVKPDGTTESVQTNGALTQYGWFEAIDLDDDGLFELVTTRNLDGTAGGFFYHAVRSYDPAARAYTAKPDGYKAYFEHELAFLNWVVERRDVIQANPEPYLSSSEIGYVYVAKFENTEFGFDSVIEVPTTMTGIADVPAYNRDRRTAFERVRKYRDELSAWLPGGQYPSLWKISK